MSYGSRPRATKKAVYRDALYRKAIKSHKMTTDELLDYQDKLNKKTASELKEMLKEVEE